MTGFLVDFFALIFIEELFLAGFFDVFLAGLSAVFFMVCADFLEAFEATAFLVVCLATCFVVGDVVLLAIAVPVRRNADAIRAARNLFMNTSLQTWEKITTR